MTGHWLLLLILQLFSAFAVALVGTIAIVVYCESVGLFRKDDLDDHHNQVN